MRYVKEVKKEKICEVKGVEVGLGGQGGQEGGRPRWSRLFGRE